MKHAFMAWYCAENVDTVPDFVFILHKWCLFDTIYADVSNSRRAWVTSGLLPNLFRCAAGERTPATLSTAIIEL